MADRRIMAARAAANPNLPSKSGATAVAPGSVGTNPALRTITPVAHCAGPVRRTRCAPMTAAQRNSEGRRSEWSASPYFFTDPKWSQTVTNQRDQ